MAVETIWSDIHHNIGLDGQGDIRRAFNIDSIITSIDNILRTHRGERVMLPTFGSGLVSGVFDNITEAAFNASADSIRESIETWDDRVVIHSIDYTTEPNKNATTFKLIFSVRGYDRIFEHSVSLAGI